MSEIKVNKLSSRTSNAITLGDTSDIVSTNTAATFKVTREGTRNITGDGSTTTALAAGDIALVDVSSATATVQLPSSPNVGDVITIIDVAQNANTNNITIDRNSEKIDNTASNYTISQTKTSIIFLYTGSTYGWTRKTTTEFDPVFISATGGTETTSGDYKIHTFNSSSNFVVSEAGNQNDTFDYLVVAGGGGGGAGNFPGSVHGGGGGGAGGLRYSADTYCNPAPTPSAGSSLTLTAATYPITVGAGGARSPNPAGPTDWGSPGGTSTFSTITSAGGGGGGRFVNSNYNYGRPGGSGGGAAGYPGRNDPGGTGNTPPVSPPQGNNGGPNNGGHPSFAGGGGGATAVGGTSAPNKGGDGGAGAASSITGSAVTRSGGGGGGCNTGVGAGGAGGGGTGDGPRSDATEGSTNTGGGAGGTWNSYGHNGGSGIVIIRYKYQN